MSQVQLIVRGTEGNVYLQRETGQGMSGSWVNLGGVVTNYMSLGYHADGRMAIFARSTDFALYVKAQLTPGGAYGDWAAT